MLKFFLVLAAGYGLVLVFIYLIQGRMRYLANVPGRTLTMTPADARMDYENVFIETTDRVTLHGWFIARKSTNQANQGKSRQIKGSDSLIS
jgi:hypothetical protein